MTKEQEFRLRQMARSSIVGGDIAAALYTIDLLRKQTNAMSIVLSAVAAEANISDDELLERLAQAGVPV